MKKFIINILLFFAIVAAIDYGVGILGDYLQTHAKGGGTRVFNDLVMKDTHDVVILGSSRAHHHYDTPFLSDTLGMDIYNAGYDGNGVVLAYGLLELMFERYQPKLIVFDVEPTFDIYVYPNDNNHKRYISSLKPYYRNKTVKALIRDVSDEEWYKVQSGMIRYNSNLVSMAIENVLTRATNQAGYLPLHGKYEGDYISESKVNEELEIDSFKLKYVEKMLVSSINQKVPIIMVASPKYGAVSSNRLDPVKEICKKYSVPFIDYYADSIFMQHKEWFKEPMHLNETGAREFSKRVIEIIKNNIR